MRGSGDSSECFFKLVFRLSASPDVVEEIQKLSHEKTVKKTMQAELPGGTRREVPSALPQEGSRRLRQGDYPIRLPLSWIRRPTTLSSAGGQGGGIRPDNWKL